MSFILDALKKSELERRRHAIPGLVDSEFRRPRARLPVWAVALCILLSVNLVVVSAVMLRSWMTAPPAAPHAPPMAEAAPTAGNDHFSPMDSAPVYAPEILTAREPAAGEPAAVARAGGAPAAGARISTHAAGTAGTASAAPASRDAVAHPIDHPDPVLAGDDHKAADEEVLPTINETSLTGAQGLPELHLDVHVFATKAADRFVYINMRKYHEGATLAEGPAIERIRRDGVILNYQGVRFLLPRQ